jgi:hypothetical protein
MPNTVIKLKRSGTVSSSPGALEFGELALNYADGKLFYKAANGTILQFESGGGSDSFGTINANGTLVVADSPGDILTLIAGNNIIITGDAVNDRITISSTVDSNTVNAVFVKANNALANTTGTFEGTLTVKNDLIVNGNTNIDAGTLYVDATNNRVGISTTNPSYNLEVNGSFAATTKSFVIKHPTKKGMKLRYGSLESPYHGVRLTGESTLNSKICRVNLPDYITGLCKQEGSQVQLTNIKHGKILWVENINIEDNYFEISCDYDLNDNKQYSFYWTFTGIRKDIEDIIVEFANE